MIKMCMNEMAQKLITPAFVTNGQSNTPLISSTCLDVVNMSAIVVNP
jgi:hypothetical protein